VFLEWMDRLTWVIENDGQYFPTWVWLIYNLYGRSSRLALSERLFRHRTYSVFFLISRLCYCWCAPSSIESEWLWDKPINS
jgi:hypothetical protein